MASFNKVQFLEEEGRQHIYEISEMRRMNYTGYRRTITQVKLFAFDRGLLKSFIHNFNIIVMIQMALAALLTFACQYTGIYFQIHPTLVVSPLVFPLAFSINADFQRREKVLEDLADFKASSMMWFFCMRDWHKDAGFDDEFMKTVSNKAKGLIIHLREYLLTAKAKHRDFVTKVLYEDFSDIAQMTDNMRKSLPQSPPLIARSLHNMGVMCSSFERLRVVREYRSPRSIRAFTKVFIFFLPILLSPYYVYLGRESQNHYSAYIVATLVSFLFGALQGVQDKLDDPFDGMSEDDINLSQLDDWTLQSLEATVNRTFKIGRFTVSAPDKKVDRRESGRFSEGVNPMKLDGLPPAWSHRPSVLRSSTNRPAWQRQLTLYSDEETSNDELDLHPYAGVLSNLPGNATILPGGQVKPNQSSQLLLESQASLVDMDVGSQHDTISSRSMMNIENGGNNSSNHATFNNPVFSGDTAAGSLQEGQDTPSSVRKFAISHPNPMTDESAISDVRSSVQTIKPNLAASSPPKNLPVGLQGLFVPPTPPVNHQQGAQVEEPVQQQQQQPQLMKEPGPPRRFKIEPLSSSSSNEDTPLLKPNSPDVVNPSADDGLALANVGVASYMRRESMSGKQRRISSSSLRSNTSDGQGSETTNSRHSPSADEAPPNRRARFTIGPTNQTDENQPKRFRMQRSISESHEISDRYHTSLETVDNSSTADLIERAPSDSKRVSERSAALRRGRRRIGSDPEVALLGATRKNPGAKYEKGNNSYA